MDRPVVFTRRGVVVVRKFMAAMCVRWSDIMSSHRTVVASTARTQCQFLLRPDPAANNAFLYCLIDAPLLLRYTPRGRARCKSVGSVCGFPGAIPDVSPGQVKQPEGRS
jgi:hypothetical protein